GPSAIMTTTRFPLYFQHDGHSRTIIGIETDAKLQPQLLILDPAKCLPTPSICLAVVLTWPTSWGGIQEGGPGVEKALRADVGRRERPGSARRPPGLRRLRRPHARPESPRARPARPSEAARRPPAEPERAQQQEAVPGMHPSLRSPIILYVLDHVPKPATADPDQPKFHTIRSLRIV
ncbi:hypothetical protein PTTG_10799, partial [Puccinia triticina 1-1 BBBD Race 1]|uniref:Uncharacterized protein n=1 Tax=Puccinia triticina (isolate 1-1 / race 1 (BBBD)) TaxID=630390 RepID=A0A0C4FC47_PUCT1